MAEELQDVLIRRNFKDLPIGGSGRRIELPVGRYRAVFVLMDVPESKPKRTP